MNKITKVFLVSSLILSVQGCSLTPESHYRVPDYYGTCLIPDRHMIGKAYDIKDLRYRSRFERPSQGWDWTE